MIKFRHWIIHQKKIKSLFTEIALLLSILAFSELSAQSLPIDYFTFPPKTEKEQVKAYYDIETCAYGLRDKKHRVVLAPEYAEIQCWGFENNFIGWHRWNDTITYRLDRDNEWSDVLQSFLFYTLITPDKKYGLADSLGNILLPAKYDYITLINEDVCLIGLNEKFGLIHLKNGSYLLPQTDLIRSFLYRGWHTTSSNRFIYIKHKNQGYLFDPTNFKYTHVDKLDIVGALSEEYFVGERMNIVKNQQKLIKSTADFHNRYEYNRIVQNEDNWENEFSEENYCYTPNYGIIDTEKNKSVIHLSGQVILPAKHEYYALYENAGNTYFWSWDKGMTGLYDENGNTILPAWYRIPEIDKEIEEFNGECTFNDWMCDYLDIRESDFYKPNDRNRPKSLILQDTQTGKYGMVSFEGKIEIPFDFETEPIIYKTTESTPQFLLSGKIKQKYGLMNLSGNVQIDFLYDTLYPFAVTHDNRNNSIDSNQQWVGVIKNKKDLLNQKGQKIFQEPFIEDYYALKDDTPLILFEKDNSRGKKKLVCSKHLSVVQYCDSVFYYYNNKYPYNRHLNTISGDTLYKLFLKKSHTDSDHDKNNIVQPYLPTYTDKNGVQSKVYGITESNHIVSPEGKIVDSFIKGRQRFTELIYFASDSSLIWVDMFSGKILKKIPHVFDVDWDRHDVSNVKTPFCKIVTHSKKTGMIDLETRAIMIDTIYEDVFYKYRRFEYDRDALFWCSLFNKKGFVLLDYHGHQACKDTFEFPIEIEELNTRIYSLEKSYGKVKYGLVKNTCEKITEAKYNHIVQLKDFFALATNEGTHDFYTEEKGLYSTDIDGFATFSTYGNVPLYDNNSYFLPYYISEEKQGTSDSYFLALRKGKIQVMNTRGDTVTPLLSQWDLVNNYDLSLYCKNREELFLKQDSDTHKRLARNIDILYESLGSKYEYSVVHYYNKFIFSASQAKHTKEDYSSAIMTDIKVASYVYNNTGYAEVSLKDLFKIDEKMRAYLHQLFTEELTKTQKLESCYNLPYLLEEIENSFYIDNQGIHFIYFHREYKITNLLINLFVPYHKLEPYILQGGLITKMR